MAVPYSTPLLEEARAAQSTDRLRRNAIMGQLHKMYVSTDRDLPLEAGIEELIDVAIRHADAVEAGPDRVVGRLAEGRALWLLGASGAGKTRALERIFLRTPLFNGDGAANGLSPLISVTVPSPFTLRQFAQDLATAMGYVTEVVLRENVAWSLVRALMPGRVMFIHVDEAHNFLENNNRVELTKARNALRGLVQRSDWPVSLILSGRPYAKLLAEDFQLGRRRTVVRFGNLGFDADAPMLRSAFASFCAKAEIGDGGLLNDDTLERLLYAARHRFGVAIEYMHDAIACALAQGASTVTRQHLKLVYQVREECESDQDNIFIMREGWRGVVPTDPDDPHIADAVVVRKTKKSDRRAP